MPFEPFFPPSSEITRQLIHRIGQRRAMTLREEAANAVTASGKETETPDELLGSILEALESDLENGADEDWEDQRWLSEVVYHFLGFQAGRARRGGENEFQQTHFVEGMSSRLGLHRIEDRELLERLAEEFSSWLNERKTPYPAGWGMIVRDEYDPNTFRLEPLPKHTSDRTDEPKVNVVTGKARAAQGGVAANLNLIER